MSRSITFYSEGFKLDGDLFLPMTRDPASVVRRQGPLPARQCPRAERGGLRGADVRLQGLRQERGPAQPVGAGGPGRRSAGRHNSPRLAGPSRRRSHRHLRHEPWRRDSGVDRGHRHTCQVCRLMRRHWAWGPLGRSVRRPDEWHDLLARARADREKRVIDGKSELADRSQILLPDRQSAELAAAARKDNPNASTRCRSSTSTRRCSSIPSGSSTRSPHARSCSSPQTMTV